MGNRRVSIQRATGGNREGGWPRRLQVISVDRSDHGRLDRLEVFSAKTILEEAVDRKNPGGGTAPNSGRRCGGRGDRRSRRIVHEGADSGSAAHPAERTGRASQGDSP